MWNNIRKTNLTNLEPKKCILFAVRKFMATFAALDSLAQQVEHNTFNVGVLGSNPRRITVKPTTCRLFLCRETVIINGSFYTINISIYYGCCVNVEPTTVWIAFIANKGNNVACLL